MSDPPLTLTRRTPSVLRVVLITLAATGGSLLATFALVHLATTFDPALTHYSHFRFSDYGTLTIVGVLCAGVAWYLATRYVSDPRHIFFRVAVVSMIVLWLPDVWLFIKHEPTRAVSYLIVMHLAIALITYNLLVFAAPIRGVSTTVVPEPRPHATNEVATSQRVSRAVWVVMMAAVALEFVSGIVGLVYVPFSRPDGWLAHRGEAIYLVHAVLGVLVGVAAVAVAFHVLHTGVRRFDRIAAWSGLSGVMVGAIGGGLCVIHSLRLLGMAAMFIGVAVAFFGYLVAMIDDTRSISSASTAAAK